ncbi:MAG: serine/threonine-protein kinase [Xanthomonadales bacterium]|nr:serine/threonine-protein kinase [Xanthomonadales bacterium]
MRPDERDTWREADRILDSLLDAPAAQREQRLANMSLTETVRGKVRLLLTAHGISGPLEQALPLPEAADDGETGQGLCGRLLGRWRLQHELGRGGMAVVYRAVAEDGATGQVAAIKVLTMACLANHGRERFVQEQQALLRLRHPYIANLYDAGIAEDGTPWMAMALVDGEHIEAWCARTELGVPARVRLVLQVCEALAYAHRNLVIHRDIKPSNVLVDNDGHVRLLDFGIARLADAVDAEATATGLRALTPEYAAPEQFAGEPPSTMMDVYGLGALLYRLLTGVAPGRRDDHSISFAAPSRAAATDSGKRAPEGASRQLRGDLDTVLLKALAAQPEDRYPSVEALAEDLQRWLKQRPVRAHPPSLAYRASKYVSRHRIGILASLMLVLALVVGLGASLWQAQRAQQQAARAVVVKEFLVHILESADPTTTQGRDPPASELLRRGAEQIGTELADRPQLHAELLLVIGRSQLARGLIDDARTSLGAALALFERGAVVDPVAQATTLSEQAMVLYEAGERADAVRMLERADRLLATQQQGGKAGPYPPQREQVRARLADLLIVALEEIERGAAIANDLAQRMRAAGRTDDINYGYALRSLGAAADMQGRPEESITWLHKAAKVMHGAARADDLARVENELGISYLNAGKPDDAEQAFRRALALQRKLLGEAHPATLATRGNLATLHLRGGKVSLAGNEFNAIERLLQSTLGDDAHPDRVRNLGWLALARYQAGESTPALASARAAWPMRNLLAAEDRAALTWFGPLLGLLLFETGHADPDHLLAQGSTECRALHELSPLSRWSCLAQAWRANAAGTCHVPDAQPPTDAASQSGIERRWWAVYWLLRADCGATTDLALAQTHIAQLADEAAPPFPAWLRTALSERQLLLL